ncbi:MAG: polyphosphate kinase 1 [Ignavibacteriales bacterium]|nr:polyphosphate kinase 1 [Ignavibacteriales bacterium]
MKKKIKNRDLSWLSFNYRVLQEAKDPNVPLFERIKFLAIYSSNLDEFFRVRVAGLRSILNVGKKTQQELNIEPVKILSEISKIVNKHQVELRQIFKTQIIPELSKNNINLIDDSKVTAKQKLFIKRYFEERVVPQIQPILLVKNRIVPFLRNRRLYLAVKLKSLESKAKKRIQFKYAIVEIPSNHLPRFVELPSDDNSTYIIFLDDIIRINLSSIFQGYKVIESYSIKLTRDAELYIDDEYSGNLVEKIKRSLIKRSIGAPSRFLYDPQIPSEFLKILTESFKINKNDLAPRGKYLSFSDFFTFPYKQNVNLFNSPLPPLRHAGLDKNPILFDAIAKKDFILYFPYQTFDYVLQFLDQAADDPKVTSIYLTLYRVAKESEVINTLVKAVLRKKKVIVFVELKARFDEESNLYWAEEMKQQGIEVLYSFPGLKVHSKLAMVNRIEENEEKSYCYLGTGNFNEKTAQLYSDLGYFTTNTKVTEEVKEVFKYLSDNKTHPKFKKLLVSRFNMRKEFVKLIDNEIELAKKGKDARIILKMNSLEDTKMIIKLYEASNAGVKIDLIIRGICCLIPGISNFSKNINIISIVDRYLEHSRIFIFNNNGNPKIYTGSADWMKRNLSRRIEVIFPIEDEEIKKEILDLIDLQLNDNVKARIIDKLDKNEYKKDRIISLNQSQLSTHKYLKNKHSADSILY